MSSGRTHPFLQLLQNAARLQGLQHEERQELGLQLPARGRVPHAGLRQYDLRFIPVLEEGCHPG
ncbi:MAG: hypothetical protein C4303_06920 [candidate division GAL15 bacterium]